MQVKDPTIREGAESYLSESGPVDEFRDEALERILFLDFSGRHSRLVAQSLDLIQGSLSGLGDDSRVAQAIERRLAKFEQVYSLEGAGMVVAVSQGGTVVGTAGYGSFANLPISEATCEIRDLAVAPVARGMGLGKRILLLTLQHATNIGYRRFYLETTAKMRSAVQLFTKIGFEPVEQQADSHESPAIVFGGQDSKAGNKQTEDSLPCYFHCDNWRRFLPYGANRS